MGTTRMENNRKWISIREVTASSKKLYCFYFGQVNNLIIIFRKILNWLQQPWLMGDESDGHNSWITMIWSQSNSEIVNFCGNCISIWIVIQYVSKYFPHFYGLDVSWYFLWLCTKAPEVADADVVLTILRNQNTIKAKTRQEMAFRLSALRCAISFWLNSNLILTFMCVQWRTLNSGEN